MLVNMASQVPTVAVITRTKDRPQFLERALRSVQAQSFQDLIHVIYNDGGDKQLVEGTIKKHPSDKIKVVHGSGSDGAPDTIFNRAIRSVDSKYIAVHDDDDSWHPDFLRLAVERLESAGAVGVVARADKITERVSGNNIEQIKSEPWMPELKAVNLYRQCVDNQLTPIAFVYAREAYEKIGGYDDSLAVVGDWDFGIRFLREYDVEYLDPGRALAFYHHRAATGSSSDSTFGSNEAKHRYYANKLMNKYLRDELAEGRLGVGYIMSKERYQQNYLSRLVHRVMPGFVARRLKRRAES